jgi:hypothetical protein
VRAPGLWLCARRAKAATAAQLRAVARGARLELSYQRLPEFKPPQFNALRAGLRTNEYEEQRRAQRALVKSDLGQRSRGAQSGFLDGDLASVASLAATYFSLNLTLRSRRKLPRFFMDSGGSRPPWAVGVGLGRVGLGLRTEF